MSLRSRKQLASTLNKAKSEAVAGGENPREVVVLTKGDIESMKSLLHPSAPATAPSALAASSGSAAGVLGDTSPSSMGSMSRKERIKQIDAERKTSGARKEDWEEADEEKRAFYLNKAGKQLLEDEDEVKSMNQVMSYAKTVAIRDKQVLEKKAIEAEKKEEERRLDRIMDIERQKAQKMYLDREQKRAEDRRRGAEVIKAQMEEREQDRQRQLEHKYNEQQAMVSHMQALKEEEVKKNSEKKQQARDMMKEVSMANMAQIKGKLKQQEQDKEEERHIAEWLKQKDEKDLGQAREAARLKHERDREIARLRLNQEKAQDEAALQAELLARRQQEARDRE
eukprot:290389_1